jgi:GNAT superfamily N-acetyltransferase
MVGRRLALRPNQVRAEAHEIRGDEACEQLDRQHLFHWCLRGPLPFNEVSDALQCIAITASLQSARTADATITSMPPVRIERIRNGVAERVVGDLAKLLVDAVDSGAGVSFLAGLTEDAAQAWWRSVLAASSERHVVLIASDAEGVVGTVQLQPSWAPNQPHRADVAKLMVHRRARGHGIARALMSSLEEAAGAAGFTLLLLDTCKGYEAERLYVSMGWVRVGEVPGFALNPDGSLCDTVF